MPHRASHKKKEAMVEISQYTELVFLNRTDCRSTRNFGRKLSSARFEGGGKILPF